VTVVTAFEDEHDYQAFERAVVADFGPRSSVEHQLVVRLASLLWRLRRATSIETGLFQIQGEFVRDKKCRNNPALDNRRLEVFYSMLRRSEVPPESGIDIASSNPTRSVAGRHTSNTDNGEVNLTCVTMASAFLRLCNLDNGALERIGRYEVALWRQAAQTLALLNVMKQHSHMKAPILGFSSRRGKIKNV
jgi:hypothetical protein